MVRCFDDDCSENKKFQEHIPMLKGFRDFILRGNVVDLAVAVVIGAAFTSIVNSLVGDIINPLISSIAKKPDFSYLVLHLHGGVIKYGNFLPVHKFLEKFHKPAAAPATKPCPECLSEIPQAARRCAHCAQPVA
jgi:large conductance mechanosensitive channel